ncbi:MAG: A/G-specific adenine glycosylase [Candidatus Udaeobacter sp.]
MTSPKNARAFHRSLLQWFRRHGRDLPWRHARDPYAILVSELMLQQTQVSTVIAYYSKWLRRFPDFISLARASENDVLHAWQGLGYYGRARNLQAAARTVVDRYRGRLPRSVEQMQQLPGIGKYTAHAVASFAFDQSVPIVESNTARVLTRLFDFRESIDSVPGRQMLWQYAAMLVPKFNASIYNSALIDLGALVCVARQPKCGICPVERFCRAKNPQILPVRKARPRTKRLIEQHAFVVRQGKILLEQSSTRWRGMWILPSFRFDCFKRTSFHRRAIYTSVFPFTNHRVALKVYSQRRQRIHPSTDEFDVANKSAQRWIRIDTLNSIPMPSPHRKAVRHLLSQVTAAESPRQPWSLL